MNAAAHSSDLNAVQWSALRFVATANESVRNIAAFARLNRTTPSSASQTIGSLVRQGLIIKVPGSDRRVRTLELTDRGRERLSSDPINGLVGAIATLDGADLRSLAQALSQIIRKSDGHMDHNDRSKCG